MKVYDAQKVSPSNNERCIVGLYDGRYDIAWQRFGEWESVLTGEGYDKESVKEWMYLENRHIQTAQFCLGIMLIFNRSQPFEDK